MTEEPMMFVVANDAAIKLLAGLLDQPFDPHGDIPIWEAVIPLRITRADINRYLYGNGNLAQIAFWVTDDGVDAVAGPDPDPPRSLFDSPESC